MPSIRRLHIKTMFALPLLLALEAGAAGSELLEPEHLMLGNFNLADLDSESSEHNFTIPVYSAGCDQDGNGEEIVVCANTRPQDFRIDAALLKAQRRLPNIYTQHDMVKRKCDPMRFSGCGTSTIPVSQIAVTAINVGAELISGGEWRDALQPMNDDAEIYGKYLKQR